MKRLKLMIIFQYMLFILIGVFLYTFLTFSHLGNKEYLVNSIKFKNTLEKKSYPIPKFSKEEILDLIKKSPNDLSLKKKLEASTINKTFFYMEQEHIQYYISANFENNESNVCRLAVKSDFILIKGLNELGFLLKENHKEYELDKSICNSLYGYGKIKI